MAALLLPVGSEESPSTSLVPSPSGGSSPRTEDPEPGRSPSPYDRGVQILPPDPGGPVQAPPRFLPPAAAPAGLGRFPGPPPPPPPPPPRVASPEADDDGAGPTRRVRWRKLEDAKIVEAVRKLGRQWPEIAAMLPGRTADSVRNRWHRLVQARGGAAAEVAESAAAFGDQTAPAALTAEDWSAVQATLASSERDGSGRKLWSAEEDALIEEGYRKHGSQWRLIAASLPAGRSDSSTRNRWNRLQRERAEAAGVADVCGSLLSLCNG